MKPFVPLHVVLAGPDDAMAIARFVAAAPDAEAFHRPEWLMAAEAACGHRAHVLLARAGGEIRAILPLNCVHSPLFGRAGVNRVCRGRRGDRRSGARACAVPGRD